MSNAPHGRSAPSRWVSERIDALDPTVPGRVLDLAAGGGRHARYCLERGLAVLAVDRDVSRLAGLAGRGGLDILQWDLEDGSAWPFAAERFAAVIVANYLNRSRMGDIMALVAPGGRLIWETFGIGNERLGRPRNPDFLARPGEIAAAARAAGLEVECDDFLTTSAPRPAVITRVCALRRRGPALSA